MIRYFNISLTLFLFSALNALSFFMLGFLYGNTSFSEIFSLTYPLQFVVSILISFFASASNIRANKENNKNCVETGIFLGLIFGIIIFSLTAIFVDKYIGFMNMNPEIYHYFTLMAMGQLFFGFITNLIAEKLYFENKDKKANICNLGFIILNLVSVVLITIITKNQITILLVNLCCLFIYCLTWLLMNLKKFSFDFSFKINFKYESMYIINDIFMFIIYLFGYSRAFSFGAEYIVALNFVNLITDPQWDSFGAISKIAKIDISQSKYNHKKALKHTIMTISFYIASSIILFFALYRTYNVNLIIGLIFLIIQASDMIIYIFKVNLQTFLQLEHSAKKCTIINILYKTIRTILSLIIISPYNTNIAQLIGGIIGLLLFLILRFKYYKMDRSGILFPKAKENSNELRSTFN